MATHVISAQVRAALTDRMRNVETLPDMRAQATQLNWRRRRYPFNRGLADYAARMPALRRALAGRQRILDIGCGAGVAAQEIRDRYGAEVITTGIVTTDAPDPQVAATAQALPFDDRSFDLVMAVQSISWEPDQIGAIREARRVLRDGGEAHLFLTPFSYGIEHRWGAEVWNEFGDARAALQALEFRPDHPDLPEGVTIHSSPLPHPFGRHDTAFYLIVAR